LKIWCARKEATPATLPFVRWHLGKEAWKASVIGVELTHACEFIMRMTLHIQKAGIVPYY
jgi:hypothetical protein